MKKNKSTILAAAITGLFLGAATGCSYSDSSTKDMEGNQQSCKGENGCKAQNSCKGENGCKAKQTCKSQNGCEGKKV